MVSPLLAVSCFVGPTACLERDKSELVSVGGANTLGWGGVVTNLAGVLALCDITEGSVVCLAHSF